MDDYQPDTLRASARNVSIAADISRLVSSSVERCRLNGGNLLHQIIDRRKFIAFGPFIQFRTCDGGDKIDKVTPTFAGMTPMIELLEVRPENLTGDLASAVHRLLRDAFPDDGFDEGDYYRKLGPPEVAVILLDDPQVCGHLGLYTREVEIGNETFHIGMLGGIVVRPDRRRRGYSRLLVQHAHEHLKARRILFSILFAYEPRIYEGSGYRLMQNSTHFIEPDGTPRTFVYRGGMYAELSQRPWPNQQLDLRGPTV
jgi:predicted N-acetyltransferase YhbS